MAGRAAYAPVGEGRLGAAEEELLVLHRQYLVDNEVGVLRDRFHLLLFKALSNQMLGLFAFQGRAASYAAAA